MASRSRYRPMSNPTSILLIWHKTERDLRRHDLLPAIPYRYITERAPQMTTQNAPSYGRLFLWSYSDKMNIVELCVAMVKCHLFSFFTFMN